MKIDVKKARNELALVVDRIRALKRIRSESHQPRWTAVEAHDLYTLKRQATLTCAMLAHRRKHLHLRALGSLEKQAEMIGDWWKQYALPDEEAA